MIKQPDSVLALIAKAEAAKSPLEAMQYSQAALNAANAYRGVFEYLAAYSPLHDFLREIPTEALKQCLSHINQAGTNVAKTIVNELNSRGPSVSDKIFSGAGG